MEKLKRYVTRECGKKKTFRNKLSIECIHVPLHGKIQNNYLAKLRSLNNGDHRKIERYENERPHCTSVPPRIGSMVRESTIDVVA